MALVLKVVEKVHRLFPRPYRALGRRSDPSALDNWISSLAFDVTGKYLAVGYNCGQVVVLTQQEDQTYQLYTEFKSHDSEFDFLTSMEIEEKINMIKWFPFKNQVQHLLTTNGTPLVPSSRSVVLPLPSLCSLLLPCPLTLRGPPVLICRFEAGIPFMFVRSLFMCSLRLERRRPFVGKSPVGSASVSSPPRPARPHLHARFISFHNCYYYN